MDEVKLQKALRQYEAQKRYSQAYYDKKKQERIESGTYRGRGRPRKVVEGKTDSAEEA